jgi:hypothetical protein
VQSRDAAVIIIRTLRFASNAHECLNPVRTEKLVWPTQAIINNMLANVILSRRLWKTIQKDGLRGRLSLREVIQLELGASI